MRNSHPNGERDTPILRDAGVVPNDAPRAVYDEFKRMYEAEQVLSLSGIFQVLRRRLWVIVLMGLLLAGLGAGYSLSQTPTYVASVTMLVTSDPKSGGDTGDLQARITGLQYLMPTITELATTLPVAEDVVERLDSSTSAETVQAGLSIEPSTESQFLYISYTDTDPERARLVANAVGEVLSERIPEINPGANAVEAKIWERAEQPGGPVSPNPLRTAVLTLMVGLMLGVGLAFLVDYVDKSWRSPDEVEKVSGVPALGVIPMFKSPKK